MTGEATSGLCINSITLYYRRLPERSSGRVNIPLSSRSGVQMCTNGVDHVGEGTVMRFIIAIYQVAN